MLSPVSWSEEGVRIIEQTRLPQEEIWTDLTSVEQVAKAIRILDVRGAPAIGIAAAFGMALAARLQPGSDPASVAQAVRRAGEQLAATRPTAVNLFWAIERIKSRTERALSKGSDADTLRKQILEEAEAIREEDIASCKAIGKHGADLMPESGTVLTHCNAGALATGGYGTALGVIRGAVAAGKKIRVLADETRPLLQGARLTTWELMRDGIDVRLICDNAAGSLMSRGEIDACVVGADRIAANGDAANKIGTYPVAVLAERHSVPFYVAAPVSTIDLALESGEQIPIEQREAAEVTHPRGVQFAPQGTQALNPAFDVTPAGLIRGIITEHGVAKHPRLPVQLAEMAENGNRGQAKNP